MNKLVSPDKWGQLLHKDSRVDSELREAIGNVFALAREKGVVATLVLSEPPPPGTEAARMVACATSSTDHAEGIQGLMYIATMWVRQQASSQQEERPKPKNETVH